MSAPITEKKHLVTSFHNLTPEMQEEVKTLYPAGFSEAMIRVDKPNGDFFYAVPFETSDTAYLIKIDVKIDDGIEDDDKDFYDEDLKGADDLQEDSSAADESSDDDIDI